MAGHAINSGSGRGHLAECGQYPVCVIFDRPHAGIDGDDGIETVIDVPGLQFGPAAGTLIWPGDFSVAELLGRTLHGNDERMVGGKFLQALPPLFNIFVRQ